jgi:hypothetical protein
MMPRRVMRATVVLSREDMSHPEPIDGWWRDDMAWDPRDVERPVVMPPPRA